jgi:hypothetical protein
MDRNKYKGFTDAELYVLKRQAIESSYEIVCGDLYKDSVKTIHGRILNEIIDEIKERDIQETRAKKNANI